MCYLLSCGILLVGDSVNLDVLKIELRYMIEDEIKALKIEPYNDMEVEIDELIDFFLQQGISYQMIPDMVLEMFLNPPEVIFIKEDGSYQRKKLTANGLHLTALIAYGNELLEQMEKPEEVLQMVLMEANPDLLTKYFYYYGITVIRIFHNSIEGKSFAATTPITNPIVEKTYKQLKSVLEQEKKGKIKFGMYDLKDYSYNFMEEDNIFLK